MKGDGLHFLQRLRGCERGGVQSWNYDLTVDLDHRQKVRPHRVLRRESWVPVEVHSNLKDGDIEALFSTLAFGIEDVSASKSYGPKR